MSITPVQKAAPPAYTLASSYVQAFGSNIAAGNLLVVCAQSGADKAVINPIVDTMSNSWNLAINYNPTAGIYENVWWAVANGSGADTVTVTFTGASYQAIEISEWNSSVVGTWTIDTAFVGNDTSSGDPQLSTAINTNFAIELVIATFHLFGSWSSTNSPFTVGDHPSNAMGWNYYLPTTTQAGLQCGINTGNRALITIGSFYISGAPPPAAAAPNVPTFWM